MIALYAAIAPAPLLLHNAHFRLIRRRHAIYWIFDRLSRFECFLPADTVDIWYSMSILFISAEISIVPFFLEYNIDDITLFISLVLLRAILHASRFISRHAEIPR